jgi:hypothetical protein
LPEQTAAAFPPPTEASALPGQIPERVVIAEELAGNVIAVVERVRLMDRSDCSWCWTVDDAFSFRASPASVVMQCFVSRGENRNGFRRCLA